MSRSGNVLVEVDSSVRELSEGSSLLELSGLLGVLLYHHHQLSQFSKFVGGVQEAEARYGVRNIGATYVFAVSHDRGVVSLEFADLRKSEYEGRDGVVV